MVEQGIGDLAGLPCFGIPDEDRVEIDPVLRVIRKVAAVGRPDRRKLGAAGVVRDEDFLERGWRAGFPLLFEKGVEVVFRVAHGKLFRVARPDKVVEHRGHRVGDLYPVFPKLVEEPDLVFPRLVGNEGDPLAVFRPDRAPFVRVRCAGQVAGNPLFERNGPDVAAGDEKSAFSAGRQFKELDVVSGIDTGRTRVERVGRHVDRNRLFGAGCGIEIFQFAGHLVDDFRDAVGTRPADVPVAVRGFLFDGVLLRVVPVKVQCAAAVGNEPDRSPRPHRVTVGARRGRDRPVGVTGLVVYH